MSAKAREVQSEKIIAKIEISASDSFNPPVTASFLLRGIGEDSSVADIYPTTVSDLLSVAAVAAGSAKVEIFTSTGKSIYSKNVKMDPFKPLEISTVSLAPGKYTVKVSSPSGTIKKTIIKI